MLEVCCDRGGMRVCSHLRYIYTSGLCSFSGSINGSNIKILMQWFYKRIDTILIQSNWVWLWMFWFWFWQYLTRGLIWHFSQSSIRPSIYLELS